MTSSWHAQDGDLIVPEVVAEQRLGGGERYEVYLGWHERLYAPVVVKVVRPHLVDDEATLRGLRREVSLLQRLAHPVVVRSFDADVEGPRPHVVLEHLDGPRLSTLLRRHGPLPLEQLLPLGLEVAAALHYLAASGVAHLDVKPSNIIMGAPPRLIDLSIARTLEECERLDHVVGTDAYLAPEQCDPPRTGTPGSPSDIWGLGATLYEAVSGQRPFPRGDRDPSAGAEQHWPQLVTDPSPLPRSVPAVVAAPIVACLARDPVARPTPAELAGQLQPLVEALPRPVLSSLRAAMR
jgi:eukaryotic-like serine/threonine-protein kinase